MQYFKNHLQTILVEILDFWTVLPIDMIAFDTIWMEFLVAVIKVVVDSFQNVKKMKRRHNE